MAPNKLRLGDHLVALKLITTDQLQKALAVQRESPAPLGSILVSLGAITEDLLLNALAAQLGVAPWRLEENPPSEKAIKRLPPHLCRSYQVLPVAVRGDLLVLAMRNPHDIDAIDLVRNFTGLRVEPVLVNPDRLEISLDEIHGVHSGASRVDEVVDRAMKDFNVDGRKSGIHREQLNEEDTRPVVELVNQILLDAIRSGASDLHIEPRGEKVEVRHRVNGMLEKVRNLPIGLHPMLTTRLKIMGEMDIVEYRLPQDGRLSVNVDNRTVDMRVSVVPTQYGQRFVFRILDKAVSVKTVNELGMDERNLSLYQNLIHNPYGIVLVTGPTGSGKTTTLYAALNQLRKVSNNIMTAEDPIEYEIDGVNQTQINDKINLTFGSQLRALLRQDPDIIMVGEIRDTDTAQTAVRAALTGHLVLSTLHCNDAPSAIPRLLDMEIEPFLLSSALKGVVSQRLARKICKHCKCEAEYQPGDAELLLNFIGGNKLPKALKGKGCQACGQSGYAGRTAIFEILPIAGRMAQMVADRAALETIKKEGQAYGYRTMTDYAIDLVVNGVTTLEEVKRMVHFDWTEEQGSQLRLAS